MGPIGLAVLTLIGYKPDRQAKFINRFRKTPLRIVMGLKAMFCSEINFTIKGDAICDIFYLISLVSNYGRRHLSNSLAVIFRGIYLLNLSFVIEVLIFFFFN